GSEALAIALNPGRPRAERPAPGLLERVVHKIGGEILSVRVDGLEDEAPHGAVLLSKDGRVLELGARPTDALALAIGKAVPVFVAESLLSEAGIDLDRLDFRRLQTPSERVESPRSTEIAL